MKRRDFIKAGAIASTFYFVPKFIHQAYRDINNFKNEEKKLLIIQLSGGNDGLNTIVPYTNDIYYKNRPNISIASRDVLPINSELGFNSSMKAFSRLNEKGYLCTINNVGYSNINRSHFRSTDIWQSASNSDENIPTGWVGRYLDHYDDKPYHSLELDNEFPLIMRGNKISGIATHNIKDLHDQSQDPFFKELMKNSYNDYHDDHHDLGYLAKTLVEVQSSVDYLYNKSKVYNSKINYPDNIFSNRLKTISELINSNSETKIYYTSLDGFDTHVNQLNTHNHLLSTLSNGIEHFITDLKQNNNFKDVLIMVYSEFGRRVKQNWGKGTDHGSANNVFVFGEGLKKKGVYNKPSNLIDLDENGDIKFEIDFRRIYSTILDKWFKVDSKKVLNGNFEHLSFI